MRQDPYQGTSIFPDHYNQKDDEVNYENEAFPSYQEIDEALKYSFKPKFKTGDDGPDVLNSLKGSAKKSYVNRI